MFQRRNPEPWDSEFIGKEAAERGSSIQSGTISSLCWHTAAFIFLEEKSLLSEQEWNKD